MVYRYHRYDAESKAWSLSWPVSRHRTGNEFENPDIQGHCNCSHFCTEDKNSDVVHTQIQEFDKALAVALGDRIIGIPAELDEHEEDDRQFVPYADDEKGEEPVMPEADIFDHDTYHHFLAARVSIPVGGELKSRMVVKRKRDKDGLLIGIANKNPILDTSLYEVVFDDRLVEAFTANVIAENIYARVDHDGNLYTLIDEIVDHEKRKDALSADDQYVMYNGKQRQRRTTRGWRFCIRWKDGSISWVDLKDLKESNPVEVAEYAVAHKLVSEPAFKWLVPYVLKKKERIIAKIKTRYLQCEQKFGIPLPKSVEEALRFDEESKTTFWQDAIRKEISCLL
jgi:hypothetical protein